MVKRYTVGFDGTSAYSLVESHANHRELTMEPHISAAVAGATGVSSGSAHTLARLLLPEVGGFSILDLEDLQLREDAVLDRTLCYCIAARHPEGDTEELWLERDTLLLRKLVSNMGWFSSEELRRDIRIDVPLEDKLFRPRRGHSLPKVLLLGVTDVGLALPEVAALVFHALGLTRWEMRQSDNHENGRYFAAYAENACLHLDDLGSLESEYRFQLTIGEPVDRTPGVGRIPESLETIAETLAQSHFNVFEPTGNWHRADWHGGGRKSRI
jgi:hypothetical protein